ncbi:hypothetical protein ACFOVU_13740 [Nocardiopsis sediminis]|uniref:Lipoprotein n=1 Tax=Nocardiopsis sediminis TaxID=1778267 RepID=A0ABV8FPM2_9ACTN
MPGRSRAALAAVLASVALAATGCSGGAADEAAALRATVGDLSSALLRPKVETEFERKGHRIKGGLECAAQKDDEAATVECNGTTRDNAQARFEGRIDHDAVADQDAADESLPGSYLGTVGGEEVFRLNCFNCRPANSAPDPEASASAPAPKIGE